MAKVCVEIERDTETGALRVGQEPEGSYEGEAQAGAAPQVEQSATAAPAAPQPGTAPGAPVPGEGAAQEEAEKPYLRPAADMDQALMMARALLEGKAAEPGQAVPGGQTAQQAAEAKFAAIRGGQ
jgi:hypothetical protein